MASGTDVLLLLGSNLGRRLRRLREGLDALPPGVIVLAASRVYATEPWGRRDQPWFLNLAALGKTRLAPEELLEYVKRIELAAGRRPAGQWGPRALDIDILLMGSAVVREPHLSVPHPRLAERRFCLVPAAEIAPEAIVPPENRTIRELLDACGDPLEVHPL